MNREELKKRTKTFGLRILNVADLLPSSPKGRAICNQIIRSGTSVGANYRSACRGRSAAEFSAKLGIVIEEADETGYWLEISRDSGLLDGNLAEPLITEASELGALFTASVRTMKRQQANAAKSGIRNPDS